MDIKTAPAGGPGPDKDGLNVDVFFISARCPHEHYCIKESWRLESPGNIFNVRSV